MESEYYSYADDNDAAAVDDNDVSIKIVLLCDDLMYSSSVLLKELLNEDYSCI